MAQKEIEISELEELQAKKLWHQLTLKLLVYVKDPNVQKKANLLYFYSKFIHPIESKMNYFALVEIISYIIPLYKDPKVAVAFLETIETKVKDNIEALVFAKVLRGEILLEKLKNQPETLILITEIDKLLSDLDEISPVHSRYYLLASQLYRLQGKHTEYYRTCLKYLGAIDLSTINQQDQLKNAFLLGLAALLSDDIYNLGELLMHPILDSLTNTSNYWLVELLHAFNNGDITKFAKMKPQWASIPDIAVQEHKLRQKISLLCLMEMTFKRQAKNRCLSFQEIAQETQLSLDQIEMLVMKALSLGLVRGKIDQVNEVVNLEWVQPRVMNKTPISGMINRLDSWCSEVKNMQYRMQDEAQEFLKV
ncbi:26S proteasome non-ATPase regulatory subunit 13 [Daktulosphaira vitifoliae]|uniref:26S proteasome non-ATPase regulatory subunit 13 n=1 Tax=Daktulosphaira vitifoliae TaxID=58002 RepID=UPI0021A9BDAE|nr:26S proteasome non-ATPase regulatory subunit 13 [Daktulosphaira vitifoliae]